MEEGFLSLLLLPWHLTGKAQVVPRAAVGAYLKFCHHYIVQAGAGGLARSLAGSSCSGGDTGFQKEQ